MNDLQKQWLYIFLLPVLGLFLAGCTDWAVDQQKLIATYPTCPTCVIPLPPQAELRNNLMNAAILNVALTAPVEEVAEFFKTTLPRQGWHVQELSLYFGGADYRLEQAGTRFILQIGRENDGTAQVKTVVSLYPCQTRDGSTLYCLE